MHPIPRDTSPDSTLARLSEGYRFVTNPRLRLPAVPRRRFVITDVAPRRGDDAVPAPPVALLRRAD
ncbi:hypothetical protein D3869_27330 (plasmid) [Azospirillum brasilense]|uniref:Uncharacterized protein n=1 Tax=Azospirillum brasilense TaxID=192 RepID=A0A4D8RHT0_AZOBR|nr:hypothetical protein [Azospirillum brasilense]QCO18969.1 hypothetical protein D3869_27330 [Azospirillum brasilense]